MPSFDIVSEVNLQELDNAVNQTTKEISQRYDFKGSKTSVEFRAKDKQLVIVAEDDYKLSAATDILQSKMVKRSLPLKNLKYETIEQATGGQVRQVITVQQGIDKEAGKKVIQVIKDMKLKVQAQIMEDQVRVTAKSIDDLQDTMRTLRSSDIPVELQFTNMRS
ncbi:MAG: YajQ family cyclic di-GMP-binding protein [Proteobacteria bacterium]|nr:MAG: YajQ family cyclic di-GMP-binding protein [Pseudomonadota bacterium]